MYLIIGLGNPGPRYELTRHNIGFLIADSLAEKQRIALSQSKYKALYGEGEIEGCQVMIVKPMTYMNNSGQAAKLILSALGISPNRVLVIHDDIDLIVGKVKIKNGGGNGGHKGLSSIDESIGRNYKRLRIGVGHPGSKELVSSHVLEKFNREDRKIIDNIIELLTEKFSLIFEDDALLLTKLASEIYKY